MKKNLLARNVRPFDALVTDPHATVELTLGGAVVFSTVRNVSRNERDVVALHAAIAIDGNTPAADPIDTPPVSLDVGDFPAPFNARLTTWELPQTPAVRKAARRVLDALAQFRTLAGLTVTGE